MSAGMILGFDLVPIALEDGALPTGLSCGQRGDAPSDESDSVLPYFCANFQLKKHAFGPDDRRFFRTLSGGGQFRVPFEKGLPYPQAYTRLQSLGEGESEPRTHLTLLDHSSDMVPSPDGRWIAFRLWQNLYITPTPDDSEFQIDLDKGLPAEVKKISQYDGRFPRWRNATTLEFTNGQQYFAYDTATGDMESVEIGLSLPRDIPSGSVALRGARIITVNGGEVIENGTLIVEGRRITCVGKRRQCDTSNVDRIIDVRGKTIMPGLIDLHAHYSSDRFDLIPLQRSSSASMLAWGVTTTHDAASRPVAFSLGEFIEAGRIVGPRTFNSGMPLFDWEDTMRINSLQDARDFVQRESNLGSLLMKSYQLATRTKRQMTIEAARETGIGVTAEANHLHHALGFALDGHTGMEHSLQYMPIYSDVAKFFGKLGFVYSPQPFLQGYMHLTSADYWTTQADLWNEPRARRWVPWQKLATRKTHDGRPRHEFSDPVIVKGAKEIVEQGGFAVIGGHGEVAGASTQWDAWAYAEAMEPMQVVETATLSGAYFLGLEQDLGSIEVGKIADLLVLNSNPLDDIRSTADIQYVMHDGRLSSPETLDEVWPDERPYGPMPWLDENILINDQVDDATAH